MAAITKPPSSTTGRRRNHRHSRWRLSSPRDGSKHLAREEAIPELEMAELRKARTAFYAKSSAARKKAVSPPTEPPQSSAVSNPSSPNPGRAQTPPRTIMGQRRRHTSSRKQTERTAPDNRDDTEYVYSRRRHRTETATPPKEKSRSHDEKRGYSISSGSSHKKSSDRRASDLNSFKNRDRGHPIRVRVADLGSRVEPILESKGDSESESEEDEPEIKKGAHSVTPARSETLREVRPSSTRGNSDRNIRNAPVPSTDDIPYRTSKVFEDAVKVAPTVASTSRRSASRLSPTVKPEIKVECLTCASDVSPSKAAHLRCDHIMCHDCLIRIFNMSITDPHHMPPRCCTSEHIPLCHVDKLFSDNFKRQWNKKYQEYTTKDRIYCPDRSCGEWIKPKYFSIDRPTGNKFAKCKYCRTKVCIKCNGKWHERRDCPNDPALKEFVQLAKDSGWQKCYNCKAMVELKEGCNHMTCRCKAEFCMLCAAKWKTCDCPWFNHEDGNDQNVFGNFDFQRIVRELPVIFGRDFGQIHQPYAADGAFPLPRYPVPLMRHGQEPQQGNAALPQAFGYQRQMEDRRRQEQMDGELAFRMQFGADMPADNLHAHFMHASGNYALDENYVRELATGAITAAFGVGQRIIRDYLNNGDNEGQRRRAVRGLARDAGRTIRRRASERGQPTQSDEQEEQLHPRIRDISPHSVHRYNPTRPPFVRRASDMAGLGTPDATGSARVGGWLDHVE